MKALVPATHTVSSSHFTDRSTLSSAASNEQSFDDSKQSMVPEHSISSPDTHLLETVDHQGIREKQQVIQPQSLEQQGTAVAEEDSQVLNYIEENILSNEPVEQPTPTFVDQHEIQSGCESNLTVHPPIIVEQHKKHTVDITAATQTPLVTIPTSEVKEHVEVSTTVSNIQNTETTGVPVDSIQDKVPRDVSSRDPSSDARLFSLQIPERPMASPGMVSVPSDITADLFPESPPNKVCIDQY